MSKCLRADSSPAASRAISSGPNEPSLRASEAWITSDIACPFIVEIRLGMGHPGEMIVVDYDKGFAKISQRTAFQRFDP
jgi:hypothetical protein